MLCGHMPLPKFRDPNREIDACSAVTNYYQVDSSIHKVQGTRLRFHRRDVGDVKSQWCRKSKRYAQVTPSWPMLEQKGVMDYCFAQKEVLRLGLAAALLGTYPRHGLLLAQRKA